MKTAVIITLGTRDIQLSSDILLNNELSDLLGKTYEIKNTELLQLSQPRQQGEIIIKNFEKFKDFLYFPIIEPAIKYVLNGTELIEKVYLFTTNQTVEDYKNKDTLFFGEIIKLLLNYKFPKKIRNVYLIEVSGNLTYYDDMYDYISEIMKSNIKFKFSEYKTYLLAQGGIDAINTALLLKSIEIFPNFFQIHKPEDKKNIDILSFPYKFKTNINKQIIKNAIYNYNYSMIIENFDTLNTSITTLCNFAYSKLNLDYQKAFNHSEELLNIGDINKSRILNVFQKEVIFDDNNLQKSKLKDLYISAKIKLKQLQYGDFLLRIFTLAENFLKPFILEFGFDISYQENTTPRHKKWIESFNKINNLENDMLKKSLEESKIRFGGLKYDTPNKFSFYGIAEYFITKEKSEHKNLLNISKSIFVLSDLRNTVAHTLKSVSRELIEQELNNKEKISLDNFMTNLDTFFSLNSKNDFGIFDQINKDIISLL